jgi:hypothetical protein
VYVVSALPVVKAPPLYSVKAVLRDHGSLASLLQCLLAAM